MKIAYLIITYNRILDAKIQMEIIRNFWSKEKNFKKITIYHAYNGKKSWYHKKYLEDHLIKTKNLGNYDGAADLIDRGLKKILNSKINFDYVIVASADVWLIKPEIIEKLIVDMRKKQKLLLTSKWFFQNALATEFFVIEFLLAKKAFPLNLGEFRREHKFISFLSNSIINKPIVEICFVHRVKTILKGKFNRSILYIPNRQSVHWLNHYYSKNLGYLSHHNMSIKREIILKSKIELKGKYVQKLLNTV